MHYVYLQLLANHIQDKSSQVKHQVNDTQVHVYHVICFQATSPDAATNGCRTLVAFVNSIVYSVDILITKMFIYGENVRIV